MPPDRPLISIVIATHGEDPALRVMLECLRTQREYRPGKCGDTGRPVSRYAGPPFAGSWEAIVVHDGVEAPWDRSPAGALQDDPRIKLTAVPQAPKPCCGHNTREPGIAVALGNWIVLTNSDNYYVSGFLHRLHEAIAAQPAAAMFWWHAINNLWRWRTAPGGAALKWGRIDLGCVAVRREIAAAVGFPWRHYSGDWNYIDACSRRAADAGQAVVEIDEVLFVHN